MVANILFPSLITFLAVPIPFLMPESSSPNVLEVYKTEVENQLEKKIEIVRPNRAYD